jgi:hypothetical protein
MSGARHRQKGDRAERELVKLHEDIGIHAERYPLSGASRFRNSGHDVDIYFRGRACPFVAEVKARKNGKCFTTQKKWLGENDLLFLRENQDPQPTVVMPWRTYVELIGGQDGAASEKVTLRFTDVEVADKGAEAR